jgi:hypothetical protein
VWEALVEELEGSGSLLVDLGSDQENSFVIFGTRALRVKTETPFFHIFGLRKKWKLLGKEMSDNLNLSTFL